MPPTKSLNVQGFPVLLAYFGYFRSLNRGPASFTVVANRRYLLLGAFNVVTTEVQGPPAAQQEVTEASVLPEVQGLPAQESSSTAGNTGTSDSATTISEESSLGVAIAPPLMLLVIGAIY